MPGLHVFKDDDSSEVSSGSTVFTYLLEYQLCYRTM